jgi:tight adherence protein C
MVATVVTFAVLAYLLSPSRGTLAVGLVGVVTVMIHPLLGIALLGCGIAVRQVYRIRRTRSVSSSASEDGVLAVELVGLGVVAGLPFRNAADLTVSHLDGSVAREIVQALRSINAGQQPSIEMPEIRAMFSAAAASETTGMPLAGTLTAMATDHRRAAAAVSRERLAKLPVKMLFPLAFLILPGFVLLTVVPPLISGLSRLGM